MPGQTRAGLIALPMTGRIAGHNPRMVRAHVRCRTDEADALGAN